MYGPTRSDRIRNKDVQDKVEVASIVDRMKMKETKLRCFGYVKKRHICPNEDA